MTAPDSDAPRIERALDAWLDWRDRGEPGSSGDFLESNAELRDLLEPIVHEQPADTELADAEEEQTLGEFRIVREIGRGGMGVVYEARQIALGRRVALKVLPAHLTLQPAAVARFQREATTASKLDRHPGLVDVYTVGRDGDTHFFAMELVEGAPLDRVLRQLREVAMPDRDGAAFGRAVRQLAGPTAPTHAWPSSRARIVADIASQVADALQHAHDAGVVHRDIKPSNILLRPDGQAVVTDFGLAREADQPALTMTGGFAGTPHYAAPEQVEPDPRHPIDARTDVFSLGATLYELLTLTRPFDEPTTREVFDRILRSDPLDPCQLDDSIPTDLGAITLKALEKAPWDRYESAADFAADLRAFLDNRPVRARRTGSIVRLARSARRNPIVSSLLGVVAILLVATSIWTTMQNSRLAERNAELEAFSDPRLVAQLLAEFDQLPAHLPAHAPALSRWVEEARIPLSRLPRYRTELDKVAARALPYTDADRRHDRATHPRAPDLAELEHTDIEHERIRRLRERVHARRTWHFDKPADRRLREALAEAIKVLERLQKPELGKLAIATGWIEHLRDDAPDRAPDVWDAAIREIAESTRYEGLALRPQRDLVPIGVDPQSGLHEFAYARSGTVPTRDEAGCLELDDQTAIVFVLIPGGATTLGALPPSENLAADAPYADPFSTDIEQPLATIDLDPYFLAKHETNQAQWVRLTGRIESAYLDGMHWNGRTLDARQPVETIRWLDADQQLRQLGLCLPTEAQWEHAARAGTTSDFPFGDEPPCLDGAANFADRTFLSTRHHVEQPDAWEWQLDDGFEIPAPIGGRTANAFGLEDVLGNVAEWTACVAGSHSDPLEPGTGARTEGRRDMRPFRGGSFSTLLYQCRSATRNFRGADEAVEDIGIRIARSIEP